MKTFAGRCCSHTGNVGDGSGESDSDFYVPCFLRLPSASFDGADESGLSWARHVSHLTAMGRHKIMSIRSVRAVSLLLAISAACVSGWALFAPRSFFASVPWWGHLWLAVDGPFNEHLVRDVGALYLALLALTGWAVRRPERELVRLTAAAWLVFSVPHLAYHVVHLTAYHVADRLLNVVSLGATVLLAGTLSLATPRGGDRADVTAG